jgi:hypothetical protein
MCRMDHLEAIDEGIQDNSNLKGTYVLKICLAH